MACGINLKYLHTLKFTPFPQRAITEHSKRQTIAGASIGLQTSRKGVWPISLYRIRQNMVASNLHFGYRMSSELIMIWHNLC